MQKLNAAIFSALAASALLCSVAAAQETQKPAALSLKECLSIALQRQTEVITAQNNVTIAKSRLAQNTSGYLPQVSIDNNAFVIGSKTGVLSQSTTGTALNITQNIFDGGMREANTLGARYSVKQSSAALDRTRQSVSYNVTQAYYEVLRSKHLAEVSEANVKYNEELRDQIKSNAELGEAAQVDVLPVEAQLANARVDLLSAKNKARTAALELQFAMGMTPEQGFDIIEMETISDIAIEPLDGYITTAVKNRPDVLQTQAGLGVARASVRAARVSLYPRPVISGNYQRSVSGGFTQTGAQFTGGIAFNLFDGGASRAAYQSAQASQANAQEQTQQLDRTIRTQVEEALLNLTSAKERVAASEASLGASASNLDAQKERYNQGLAITLDLLNAEVQLVTAQSNAIQAKYDYYTAIAQMDYATGGQGGLK
ncbi:MAG: TolC family protein [Armatimonadetes bacterium]|nr:TolC family protein [Armatimonadota bacterium]